MALLANVNRDPKKRAKPFTIEDFRLGWSRPAPQSPSSMKNVAIAITRMFGGKVGRDSGG